LADFYSQKPVNADWWFYSYWSCRQYWCENLCQKVAFKELIKHTYVCQLFLQMAILKNTDYQVISISLELYLTAQAVKLPKHAKFIKSSFCTKRAHSI